MDPIIEVKPPIPDGIEPPEPIMLVRGPRTLDRPLEISYTAQKLNLNIDWLVIITAGQANEDELDMVKVIGMPMMLILGVTS